MSDGNNGDSGDLDTEAAEYVLGTLPLAARLDFAARLGSDAAARGAVAAWERRLAGLAERLPPVAPPQAVWAGIEQSLGHTAEVIPHLRLVPGPVRAGDRAGDVVPHLRRSVNRWRRASVALGALAAALLVFVGIRGLSPQPEPASYIAAVNRGGDKPALLVRVDLQTHRITVMPVAAEAPADKSLQLWYIGAGRPPRSMGLVDRAARSMPMPSEVQAEAASFAVSVEPPGGSKADGPSGPVAYSGQLIRE